MNEEKIALRKRAIQLMLNGGTKTGIAQQLGQSRLWVQRWTTRYQPDNPEGSLQDQASTPKQPYRKWSDSIRQMVLNSRQARQEAQQPNYQHALIGAEAIYYELRELGVSPLPPIRTIHSWLKQADRFGRKTPEVKEHPAPKPNPAPTSTACNDLHELDLKGPFYLSGSPQKYYLLALRDVYSKRVALGVSQDKRMETIIDFLVSSWQKLGLPKVLQMDNGLKFRGSNRYPRSLGQLLRVCLDLGVEPLFIPPHEPWRNGVIENLNGLLDRLLLQQETFKDFTQLQSGTLEVETAINTTHRLPALAGKTPSEFAQNSNLQLLPQAYDWRKRDLQLVKSKVSFIRLVRKSGRITLCANDKFEIGSDYQWQYVLAQANFATHHLDVFLQGQLIKSFDYS